MWFLCTKCWRAGPLWRLFTANEAWSCPWCGMDESGLELYSSDPENKPPTMVEKMPRKKEAFPHG